MTVSPFASLQPMPANFEATHPIKDLWQSTFQVLGAAANADALIEELTGYIAADLPTRREELLAIAASVVLQASIEEERLNVYVSDGNRFYLMPPHAFVSQFIGQISDGTPTRLAKRSVEHSLSTGVLSQIDTGEEFRWACDLRLPLLVRAVDRDAVLGRLREMVTPPASQGKTKREIAEEHMQIKTERAAAEMELEPYWTLIETLLWIGLRDFRAVALPAIYWREHFPDLQSGSIIMMAHTYLAEHAKEGELVHTAKPHELLEAALRRGEVIATGLSRGEGDRADIPARDWMDVMLVDGPSAFSGDASAFMPKWMVQAGPHWTRLRFDRRTVLSTFAPLDSERVPAHDEEPADSPIQAALEAMKRDGHALAPRTVARYVVDLRWPAKRGGARQKLIDTMRHWTPAKWAEISEIAETIGVKPK